MAFITISQTPQSVLSTFRAIVVTITAVTLLSSCKTTITQDITPIDRLKAMRNDTTSNQLESFGEKEYMVEGYFYKDPIPMLVTNLKWTQVNTPMPDSVFLVLGGPVLEQVNRNLSRFQGSLIRIRGKLNNMKSNALVQDTAANKTIRFTPEFFSIDSVQLIRNKPTSFIVPQVPDLCRLNPAFCTTNFRASPHYALLYSGGYNLNNAHRRYWNDLKLMYYTLKSRYGYTDDHIIVVYKDGVGEDADMIVDYAASPIGLSTAISVLQRNANATTDLYVFLTNHGGGYRIESGLNEGGLIDGGTGTALKDEIDPIPHRRNNILLRAGKQ